MLVPGLLPIPTNADPQDSSRQHRLQFMLRSSLLLLLLRVLLLLLLLLLETPARGRPQQEQLGLVPIQALA